MSSNGRGAGSMEKMPEGSRLSLSEWREAVDLLQRWAVAAGEDGCNDDEHEVGIDMSEFIFRMTSLPVGWNENEKGGS